MALGAYGYAISILSFGWPWWVGIIVGCIAAALFAFILGIPTLRLRADYLAIVTIAAAEIVRLLFTTQLFDEWTNSADGLGGYHAGFRAANPFPPGHVRLRPVEVQRDRPLGARLRPRRCSRSPCYLVWALMRSPWGRVLKGIREDEDAVRSLGKNVFAYKMQALVVGGVFGALGGVVFVAPLGRRPVDLHDVADVLPLDDPAARRRGDGLRPVARCGDLLGHHGASSATCFPTLAQCRHPAAAVDPGGHAALHPGRRRADAAS